MTKTYSVRKQLRTPVQCSFSYFCDGVLAKGLIRDLSESGWRATGERHLAVGTELTVYLTLPNSGESKHILIDTAVVRWSEGRDAGWEIIRMDDEARSRLDQFLEELTATAVTSETRERTHSW